MQLHVLDDQMRSLQDGQVGEIYLSGRQVNAGYLNAEDQTRRAFVTLHDGTAAYKTGDRAQIDSNGDVQFLGRVDNQVKVRGYRIELSEIEATLRTLCNGSNAVALAWPHDAAAPRAIVAAVEGASLDTSALLSKLADRLPEYMVPADIHVLDRFPLNASGKTDRAAIAVTVAERQTRSRATSANLSRFQAQVMDVILGVAPALSATRVLAAESLLGAGMDSLSFINFTMAVETEFGITLSQEEVVAFSEMPFARLVRELETRRAGRAGAHQSILAFASKIARFFRLPRRRPNTRARRVRQFIQHFPTQITSPGPPFVLVVGSSGVLRGFVPTVMEQMARQQGISIRALNIGLPAVTPQGLAQICAFIRDECHRASIRVPLVIWEFDPMHVSTTPPAGDIMLGPEYFAAAPDRLADADVAGEFDWSPEVGGAWLPPAHQLQVKRQPDWLRQRDLLIARAYRGDFSLDLARFEAWKGGANALRDTADRVVCFLPPADQSMLDEVQSDTQLDTLAKALTEISNDLSMEVIPSEVFKLDRGDFLDINHANATGRHTLTRQMSAYVLAAKLLEAADKAVAPGEAMQVNRNLPE